MTETKLDTLLENYRQDGEDYRVLLEALTKFHQTLELHRPAPVSSESLMKGTADPKQDDHESENPVQKEKEYLTDLDDYLRFRESHVENIMKRAKESSGLCQNICHDYGMEQFTLAALRRTGKLQTEKINQLEKSLNDLTETMEKVIVLDKEITERLQKDYSAAKQQIQRLQGRHQAKNAYQGNGVQEAYFFDKNK